MAASVTGVTQISHRTTSGMHAMHADASINDFVSGSCLSKGSTEAPQGQGIKSGVKNCLLATPKLFHGTTL